MNKAKFLSSKGVSLIGVGLLIVGLAVLLVLSPDIVLGQGKDKGGKPEKPGKPQPPALYRVYFSTTPPDMGIDTVTYPGCNGYHRYSNLPGLQRIRLCACGVGCCTQLSPCEWNVD